MQSDVGGVYTTNFHGGVAPPPPQDGGALDGLVGDTDNAIDADAAHQQMLAAVDDAAALFAAFLTHFRLGGEFLYSVMLRENLRGALHFLEVNVAHIQQFSEKLFHMVQHSPSRTLPRLEAAAVRVAEERRLFIPGGRRDLQIQFFWGVVPLSIRHLAQAQVARLVCLNGIVIKSSATHARCVRAAIQCTSCRSKAFVAGGRSVELPPQCQENGGRQGGGQGTMGGGGGGGKCRPNPYVVLPMECEYEDQQVLKLQELPEDVPTGELPRHITVVVDRYIVDRASPGSRVQVVGIVSVQEKRGGGETNGGKQQSKALRATAGLRAQYIRACGLMNISTKTNGVNVVSIHQNFSSRVRSRTNCVWQPEDEAAFKAFSKKGNVNEILAACIDPAIFGLLDPKKAIVSLLFSGTRKRQDTGNTFLRGDINVLLIGDPSTAKSQLLKFTEKVAPIAIYTSGKGSSAAGLTATVVSSGGGDFYLEAGSLVLADGGVVCIDEFDKMRDQDQVAIHEAMEQQTISIAKANLTTMLNSRTSVLAAANPTLGSYDPMQSNEDQMDFQGSILSRFDLIFKVLDPRNPEMDHRLANHVVNLHKRAAATSTSRRGGGAASHGAAAAGGSAAGAQPTVERAFITKYIAYAKATCHPTISQECQAVLLDYFVQVRRESHKHTLEALKSSSAKAPVIQITARQLESMVRISESLAKMRLDTVATAADAHEAIRLFQVATVDAMQSGIVDNTLMNEFQSGQVIKIEEAVRRRVPVGTTVEYPRLISELLKMSFDSKLVDRALFVMLRRDELEFRKQRTQIHRLR
jgi:DNA replication licensing factor MCM5